jgi:hypothetical protein
MQMVEFVIDEMGNVVRAMHQDAQRIVVDVLDVGSTPTSNQYEAQHD